MIALLLLAGCSLTTGGNLPQAPADSGQETPDAQELQTDAHDAALAQDAGLDAETTSGDGGRRRPDSAHDATPSCEAQRFALGDIAQGTNATAEVSGSSYAEICIEWSEVSISSRTLTIGSTVRCLPCDGVTSYCFPFEPGEIRIDNTHCAADSCGAQTAMEDVVVEVHCE